MPDEPHIAQMLGYRNITGLRTALLLNFKHGKLQINRVSNGAFLLSSSVPIRVIRGSFPFVHLWIDQKPG